MPQNRASTYTHTHTHYGNQQIPKHFPTCQIFIPNHFPTKLTWFPWLFRSKISNFSIYFFKISELFHLSFFQLRHIFEDSQPLWTNITNSQPIPCWEWPKLNFQLFCKLPTGVWTLHNRYYYIGLELLVGMMTFPLAQFQSEYCSLICDINCSKGGITFCHRCHRSEDNVGHLDVSSLLAAGSNIRTWINTVTTNETLPSLYG